MTRFKTVIKARYLRKEKTKAEEILWQELRGDKLGVKFRRQHPIDMYILDFYAPSLKLAIELDGEGHREKDTKAYDQERSDYLGNKQIKVLRFWNSEVENNLEAVLGIIRKEF